MSVVFCTPLVKCLLILLRLAYKVKNFFRIILGFFELYFRELILPLKTATLLLDNVAVICNIIQQFMIAGSDIKLCCDNVFIVITRIPRIAEGVRKCYFFYYTVMSGR